MSLDERLNAFAEAWKPEPGQKLVGVVVDLDERDSAFGDEPYPIVTVETDEGDEVAFHAFHTVARRELAKQRPAVGDRIGIAYHGKKDGKNYESYRVIVERVDPEPKTIDWERIAAETPELNDETEPDDEPAKEASEDDIPF